MKFLEMREFSVNTNSLTISSSYVGTSRKAEYTWNDISHNEEWVKILFIPFFLFNKTLTFVLQLFRLSSPFLWYVNYFLLLSYYCTKCTAATSLWGRWRLFSFNWGGSSSWNESKEGIVASGYAGLMTRKEANEPGTRW